MKGYVLSVVGTVLLSSIITVILPNGKTAVTIKGVAKGACVLIILSPVLTFFQEQANLLTAEHNSSANLLQTSIETDDAFIQYVSNERVIMAQNQLKKELKEKFDLDATVVFSWQWKNSGLSKNEEIYISKILVRGTEQVSSEKKEEVLEYLRKNYCEEVLLE